jgi:hypothetical protein
VKFKRSLPSFFVLTIAGGANQIGLRDIAEFFDLGEQFGCGEHGEWKELSVSTVSNCLELSMA